MGIWKLRFEYIRTLCSRTLATSVVGSIREQEATDAVHDLFLGTQLGISVTVPCQKERDEEAKEHERMIKHLKKLIFSDTNGLEDEEFEAKDKKSSWKGNRGKRGRRH